MTLPAERTRAFIQARDFLVRLSNPYMPNGVRGVPTSVRREALGILRHFPYVHDVLNPGMWDEGVVEDYYEELDSGPNPPPGGHKSS